MYLLFHIRSEMKKRVERCERKATNDHRQTTVKKTKFEKHENWGFSGRDRCERNRKFIIGKLLSFPLW